MRREKITPGEAWRAVSYRTPRRVTDCAGMKNGDCFPVCPRCDVTLEREYMRYCDRCGQALS